MNTDEDRVGRMEEKLEAKHKDVTAKDNWGLLFGL
jgi:hypothetical protein